MNDPDQKSVYSAEERVRGWLTTAKNGILSIDGDIYEPETEVVFSTVEDVQRYVNQVMDYLTKTSDGYANMGHVLIRERAGHAHAHYESGTQTIAIPPRILTKEGDRAEEGSLSWAMREIIVLHEMAHHLAGPGTHHGPDFQHTFIRLLEDIGKPVIAELLTLSFQQADLLQGAEDNSMLRKVSKLLRLAETTKNEAERDAYMAKAQSLATANSIALAVARAKTAKSEAREVPTYKRITIGQRGQRGLARFCRLAINVAEANDCKVLISRHSTFIEAYGLPSDIAVIEAMVASLLVQMVSAADVYIKSGVYKNEKADTYRYDTVEVGTDPVMKRGEFVEYRREIKIRVYVGGVREERAMDEVTIARQIHGSTARDSFYQGYANRIGQRLRNAKQEAIAKAEMDDVEAGETVHVESTSTALAIRAKEIEVHDYYAAELKRQRIRGSWGGEKAQRQSSVSSSHAGRTAADRASLGTERAIG